VRIFVIKDKHRIDHVSSELINAKRLELLRCVSRSPIEKDSTTFQGGKSPATFKEVVANGIASSIQSNKDTQDYPLQKEGVILLDKSSIKKMVELSAKNSPLRYVILGHAGTGKTTLLNYFSSCMALSILNQDQSTSEYDWVFKLNCRNIEIDKLMNQNDTIDSVIVDLIMSTYFSQECRLGNGLGSLDI